MSGEAFEAGDHGDPATDVHWLALQLDALFVHDAGGRITTTREPGGRRAPAFALSRSRLGNLWRLGAWLAPSARRALARLAGRERPLGAGDPPAPPERIEAFRRVLREHDVEIGREWRGPAYRFPDPPAPAPGLPDAIRVTLDADPAAIALCDETRWLRDEWDARAPIAVAVADGRIEAACWSARREQAPVPAAGSDCAAISRGFEAGVWTRPERRGEGLGSGVVAAWAAGVRALGAHPLYSTSWDNAASIGVARRLRLVRFGENLHLG